MTVGDVTGFDPDDMFGVRRALQALPEPLWDDFFAIWMRLADHCELDLERMRCSVAQEAAAAARRDGNGGLAGAWESVGAAMSSYLEWKSSRPGSPSQLGIASDRT